MAAAARGNARPAAPELELTARRTPPPPPERRAAPEIRVETKRPLPYPEPVAINDNEDDDAPEDFRPAPRTQRRRLNFLQLLARIVIAPLYVAVAAAAIAVIALFVRSWISG